MLGLAVAHEGDGLRPRRWRRWCRGLQGGGHAGRAARQQGDDECDACQLAPTCCTVVLACCDALCGESSQLAPRRDGVCCCADCAGVSSAAAYAALDLQFVAAALRLCALGLVRSSLALVACSRVVQGCRLARLRGLLSGHLHFGRQCTPKNATETPGRSALTYRLRLETDSCSAARLRIQLCKGSRFSCNHALAATPGQGEGPGDAYLGSQRSFALMVAVEQAAPRRRRPSPAAAPSHRRGSLQPESSRRRASPPREPSRQGAKPRTGTASRTHCRPEENTHWSSSSCLE